MADPKLAEYRKAMAARYAQLSPEEKPHVEICDTCKQPAHTRRVCVVTGLLHQREKMRLIGGTAVDSDKHQFTGKELMTAIDAGRIKWQKARVGTVYIDSDASDFFQSFPLQRSWKQMRFGFMYGKYDAPNRAVHVHAIYEPTQEGDDAGFRLGPDPREARINLLAESLGLERVGVILTHPPRDTNEVILSGTELLLAARDQSRFGDHCVCVTVSPDPTTKELAAQPWQTSEQCVRLFQMGTLAPSSEKLGYVTSSIALEVGKEEKDDKGKALFKVMDPSHEIDTRFMTAPAAIKPFKSDIVANRFVRIDRPGVAPVTFANIDVYLKDEKRAKDPFHKKIRDFHVLVFLVDQLLTTNSGFREADVKGFIQSMLKEDAVGVAKLENWVLQKCKK